MADLQTRKSPLVGVELADRAVFAAVVATDGQLISTRTVAVADPERSVDQLIALITEIKADVAGIDSVGLAVPGLVERSTGRVAFSANTPKHSGVDLAKQIASATGLAVRLENDANAAAYGEYRLGAGRGSNNLFYATLGAGVGGAFILDGELWRGASGFAGEFGYVPINSEGARLEDVASTSNIIRRTRSRFYQDSTSSLSKLDEEAIDLAAIIAAAENEDDFAQLMLQRTGIYVGTAIASVINLVNVEKIVVGGEIMQARHVVLDAIIERARELSFEPSFASTSIVEGELGSSAAAVGAALLNE